MASGLQLQRLYKLGNILDKGLDGRRTVTVWQVDNVQIRLGDSAVLGQDHFYLTAPDFVREF